MNTNRKTTVSQGGKLANTNGQTALKESKMKITTSKLIRWSGLAAMRSGIIFIAIQPIHPLDVLSSVTTSTWAIVQSLKFTMALLGLLVIAGKYFYDSHVIPAAPQTTDMAVARKLWDVSAKMVHLADGLPAMT